MQRADRPSLWALTLASGAGRWLSDDMERTALDDLRAGSSLDAPVETFRGKSLLIATDAQRPAVLAAIALDGVARRILLCPPDIDPAHLPAILAEGQVDAIATDGTGPAAGLAHGLPVISCSTIAAPAADPPPARDMQTEWVLFTSGTTGRPKMVAHTLPSLSGPLDDGLTVASGAVWSTFYDVRRYGGLQILLRALIGGGSMVLSSAHEAVGDFLVRAGVSGVTHISGTPSHWRRALMSPSAPSMAPAYVRLSGEVADQAILDHLCTTPIPAAVSPTPSRRPRPGLVSTCAMAWLASPPPISARPAPRRSCLCRTAACASAPRARRPVYPARPGAKPW